MHWHIWTPAERAGHATLKRGRAIYSKSSAYREAEQFRHRNRHSITLVRLCTDIHCRQYQHEHQYESWN